MGVCMYKINKRLDSLNFQFSDRVGYRNDEIMGKGIKAIKSAH